MIYAKPTERKRQFYNVAVAGSITGYVRAKLLRAKCHVRNAYYCDTDSLICESPNDLPMGNRLGSWKVEMICDELRIAGKKLYSVKDAETQEWKNVSKGAKLDEVMMKRVCEGEEIEYVFDAPNFSVLRGISFVSRTIRKTA